MKQQNYVAYGSNLNLRQMAMRCPNARLIGTGAVKDYELQFKGSPYGAFATIGKKEGAFVPVAVWSLQPRDERALDTYEGYPYHYYKVNLPVLMEDGSEIAARVYIMNQRMQFGIPSQRYYDTVYEGYENCGLDVNILNQAVDDSIAMRREKEKEQADSEERYTWNWDQFKGGKQESIDGPDEDNPFQMHL